MKLTEAESSGPLSRVEKSIYFLCKIKSQSEIERQKYYFEQIQQKTFHSVTIVLLV